jgi:lipid-A-disaccharide synthase
MMAADFGWITSGTATLEAAYYSLPHILCYKLSYLSALIIRITTNYFSKDNRFAGLPNILLGREVVPELLQSRWTARQLALETVELLSDSTRLTRMKKELRYVPQKMGEAGATERIAKDLLQLWSQASKGSHG